MALIHVSAVPILRLSQSYRRDAGQIGRRLYDQWSSAPSSKLVSDCLFFFPAATRSLRSFVYICISSLQDRARQIRRRPVRLWSSGSRTSSPAVRWESSGSASSSGTSRAVSRSTARKRARRRKEVGASRTRHNPNTRRPWKSFRWSCKGPIIDFNCLCGTVCHDPLTYTVCDLPVYPCYIMQGMDNQLPCELHSIMLSISIFRQSSR